MELSKGIIGSQDYKEMQRRTDEEKRILTYSDPVRKSRLQLGSDAISDASRELCESIDKWPEFNSAHEGFAVLKEEVDELWDHVKTNQKRRDIRLMRREAIQVAAMALRFAADVCNETVGRK